MEILLIIIGAIASGLTILDFISVRIKKRTARRGITLKEFEVRNMPDDDLRIQYEGYRIPNEEDLSKGDWSWVYDGKNLPFITHGNFFGDGKLSEALILINEKHENAIIVVKSYGENKYIELMSPPNSPYNIQLNTVPLGEYESHWEKLNLKLEVHGIRVTFLESAEVIMYWDNVTSGFKEYWTED